MNVLLRALGEVVVDDVRQVRDVDPARRDVGRYQKTQAPLSGRRHDALAVVLREVAVEPVGVEAARLQGLGHALGLVARVAEHDGALGVFDLEDAHELVALVGLAHHVDVVGDLERSDLVARERDDLGVLELRVRQALDVRRDGGAEEEPLPALREGLEDGVEFASEAHRQHLVGFVEHEDTDAARVERLLAQVIEHAAGRAADDLRAALERLDLLAHRRAAVDGDDLDTLVLTDLLDLAADLERELARRAEHQRLHRLDRRPHQAIDHRQPERRGLAGSGSSLNDEAAPLGSRLEDGSLHRGRMAIAHLVDGPPNLGAQREDVERRLGRGGFRG